MAEITDEFMSEMLAKTRPYSVVLLRAGPNHDVPDVGAIVWEHGRRNFSLRADGHLAIVCPVVDGTDWRGIGIFPGTVEDVTEIMEGDPGVQAGVFTFEVHPVISFPGDCLPA
jgi:hypothetical protein